MMIHDVLLSRLKEYENNPRNIDLAVEKVKYSIERFGFLCPIIIDINYVIVAGHTRVRACRELGIRTVPCIIADDLTEEQVNLFRVVDNKSHEYSSWDFEKLKSELARVDLTIDKNQILLERFELTTEVFDIEPEQAEIKIPTLNFMSANTKIEPIKKTSVSTIHSESEKLQSKGRVDSIEFENKIDPFEDKYSNTNNTIKSESSYVENVEQHITDEDFEEFVEPTKITRESKPMLLTYQFRFGDVAFFISKVENDRLNTKYAEYIDTNAVLSCSFAEYLLRGVEGHD